MPISVLFCPLLFVHFSLIFTPIFVFHPIYSSFCLLYNYWNILFKLEFYFAAFIDKLFTELFRIAYPLRNWRSYIKYLPIIFFEFSFFHCLFEGFRCIIRILVCLAYNFATSTSLSLGRAEVASLFVTIPADWILIQSEGPRGPSFWVPAKAVKETHRGFCEKAPRAANVLSCLRNHVKPLSQFLLVNLYLHTVVTGKQKPENLTMWIRKKSEYVL